MPPREGLLELGTRRKIYDHLQLAPGLHLRQIQRDLQIPMGTLEYHLHQMEKAGLVVVREDGRFKAFFTNDGLDRRDRDFLYYLRQEMPRRIALEVVDWPNISFQELGGRLPIGPSTLSFHLKKLKFGGLVEEHRDGNRKTYTCTDPPRVRMLIVRYRPTFIDDVVDRFAAAWLDLGLA